MQIPEVYVFPLNTDNQKIVDLKQLLAAQKSIQDLDKELATGEHYSNGWTRELQARRAQCVDIINEIKEKYKGN